MSAASRKLFKEMIAEAARMPDFNYRSYFLRRITHSFKEGEEFRKDEDIHKWGKLKFIDFFAFWSDRLKV